MERRGGDAGPLTCPPRRRRRCGSRRPSAASTCRWAARGSGWCSSAQETARRCPAPRTAARCEPSHPPAAPPACWGAAGGLQGRAGQASQVSWPWTGCAFSRRGRRCSGLRPQAPALAQQPASTRVAPGQRRGLRGLGTDTSRRQPSQRRTVRR